MRELKFLLLDIANRELPWYLKALNEKFSLKVEWGLPQPNEPDTLNISYIEGGHYNIKTISEKDPKILQEKYAQVISELIDKMSPWYLSVVDEKLELERKMDYIVGFLNAPMVMDMKNLSSFQRNLLREQYGAMSNYVSILEKRLSYNF